MKGMELVKLFRENGWKLDWITGTLTKLLKDAGLK